MYIGELCRLTGATQRAIHHYENIGLIPKPARKGKYRVYTGEYIALINIIKKAQSVGFKLDELIRLIQEKSLTHQFPMAMAEKMIHNKRRDLQEQKQKIEQQDRELAGLHMEIMALFKASPN